MEPKTRTRRPSAAERLAARALGRPEPEGIVVEVTSSAALHAERLAAPRVSAKPEGMQTADWYARRATGRAEPVGERDEEEPEEAPRPLPRWAQSWVYRPGGGDAA